MAGEPKPDEHIERIQAYYAHGVDARFGSAERAYENLGYWAENPGSFEEAGARLCAAVVERAGAGSEDDVLDVGCGCGASTLDLAAVWGCRSVVGIDVTEPMLATGRREATRRALDGRVRFQAMSATALAIPDASFTRVFAVDCACLFAPREAFLAEAFRVLQPGGVLAIGDTIAGPARVGAAQRALLRGLMRYWNIPAANYYGLAGYRDRIAAAGFVDVTAETVGDEVFPGAAACALSERFQREYRAAVGRVETWRNSLVFRLVARAHRQGLVDFAFLVARKPG